MGSPSRRCGETYSGQGATTIPEPGNACSPNISSVRAGEIDHAAACMALLGTAGAWIRLQRIIDGTEFEQHQLFNHYRMHTTRSIAVGSAELYAMTVGIGKLACDSIVVMDSVLALAAVDKCHRALRKAALHADDYSHATKMLCSAEHYHSQALQRTRSDLYHMNRHDHLMANAALMVLYSCASHSVRIRLETRGQGNPHRYLPRELAPAPFQWISLIWAIRTAYSGLLDVKPNPPGMSNFIRALQIATTEDSSTLGNPFGQRLSPGDKGTTERTAHLFRPIVAATWTRALERLHSVARATMDAAQEEHLSTQKYVTGTNEDIRENSLSVDIDVCIQSLDLLQTIFTKVFSIEPSSASPSSASPSSPAEEIYITVGGTGMDNLTEIEPWLRTYLARITSKTMPTPLRRIVMAFIHWLPARFFDLLRMSLDLFQTNHGDDQGIGCEPMLSKLVIDIFAHWLVLVLLLDGVWWIGGIGAWELERVISVMRNIRRLDGTLTQKTWWPQSMFNIIKEIENHTTET
jgi:hypothetical protein